MKIKSSIDIKLSEKLIDRISKTLAEGNQPHYYWDYNDDVDANTIHKTLEDESGEIPYDVFTSNIWDCNSEAVYDIEVNCIEECLKMFRDEILEEIRVEFPDYDEYDLDLKELANELRDEECMYEYIQIDMNYKQLLRGMVNVRIEMHSNYDCINSDWLESQSPYRMDSYFGDMVRILEFNPAAMRKFLISKGRKTQGQWPNRPWKQQLVSWDDFWQELTNTSCGANLLCFVGKMDKHDLLMAGKKGIVTIPAGNCAGMFSSFQGGGSVIEMKLLRNHKIDLGKHYDKSGYLSFFLEVDCRANEYCIEHVYGVTSEFWGDEIGICPAKELRKKKVK